MENLQEHRDVQLSFLISRHSEYANGVYHVQHSNLNKNWTKYISSKYGNRHSGNKQNQYYISSK